MAPCYNNMRSLHYRTQSLPESVYTTHMFQLAQQQQQQAAEYHHSRQLLLQQQQHHHQHQQHLLHQQQHLQHNDKLLHATHPSSAIKKRTSVRRSQTNVCDLVGLPSSLAHHRAPLTAGVYEAFLPPPNFNAVGLPVDTSGRLAAGGSSIGRPRAVPAVASRTQSFYLPATSSSSSGLLQQRTTSLSQHYNRLHQQQQQQQMLLGSQHDLSRSAESMMMASHHHQQQQQQQQQQHLHHQQHSYPGLNYSNSSSSMVGGAVGLLAVDQKQNNSLPSASPFPWYPSNSQQPAQLPQHHRSVPNIPTTSSLPASLTTPLFVDCSVEYDLGDQPPVPANSEPLLAIHPEYARGLKAAIRSLKASPYSLPLYGAVAPRPAGKLKSAAAAPSRGSPATVEEAIRLQHHKSLPDIQSGSGGGYTAARRSGVTQQSRQVIQQSVAVPEANGKTTMLSSAEMMEAVTRKLSVESRDSGIGLLMNSAGQQHQLVVAVKETTAGSCGSSSCGAAVNHNNTGSITTSSSASSWQLAGHHHHHQQQQQHFHHLCDNIQQHHYLPQSTVGAVYPNNNNSTKGAQPNSRRFAFTGNRKTIPNVKSLQ